jgi:hypothetical protein
MSSCDDSYSFFASVGLSTRLRLYNIDPSLLQPVRNPDNPRQRPKYEQLWKAPIVEFGRIPCPRTWIEDCAKPGQLSITQESVVEHIMLTIDLT